MSFLRASAADMDLWIWRRCDVVVIVHRPHHGHVSPVIPELFFVLKYGGRNKYYENEDLLRKFKSLA